MNTCDTCKHFRGVWGDLQSYPVHRKCENEKLRPSKPFKEDTAITAYGIYVGPRFGCIHHEPK